jgi:hypothetical protein
MERTRVSILAGFLCLLGVWGCSDNPNEVKLVPDRPALVITPSQTLDQSINSLLDLFPRELRQHDEDRRKSGEAADLHPKLAWFIIKVTYQVGRTRPAIMTLAKRELFWLSDWITRNAQKMNTPPNGETKTAAAARVVLYMSLYVYSGPTTTIPSYTPTADAVVGTVTPTAAATIITPSSRAAVEFKAGSVDENTVIVITQNPTPYPDDCSGPLETKLCQYPQFYIFSQFPEKTLRIPATVNVCHINSGTSRRPLADHDRFKLAHTRPANPADYTTGSTIRKDNGENIEILPMVEQTFSTCPSTNSYAAKVVAPGSLGVLSRFARDLRELVTPKTAYAVDLGLGGVTKRFSPFNVVDPEGLPDLAVNPLAAVVGSVAPGGNVAVSYSVKNIGTATSTAVPATIRLTRPAVGGSPAVDVVLASLTVPALLPGATFAPPTSQVVVPTDIEDGAYKLRAVVSDDEVFHEISLANNSAETGVIVGTVRGNSIRVTAQIDGRSQLWLNGNLAQWRHFDYSAPGKWNGNFPTTINGYDWYPEWPGGMGWGSSSSFYDGVSPELPASDLPITVDVIEGRGVVTVVQQRTADNGYSAIIEFDDNIPFGAGIYTVEILFGSPPIH